MYVFAFPLCLIFQYNFNSGILPNTRKCANIVPVYKGNGNKFKQEYINIYSWFKVENYRLILALPQHNIK